MTTSTETPKNAVNSADDYEWRQHSRVTIAIRDFIESRYENSWPKFYDSVIDNVDSYLESKFKDDFSSFLTINHFDDIDEKVFDKSWNFNKKKIFLRELVEVWFSLEKNRQWLKEVIEDDFIFLDKNSKKVNYKSLPKTESDNMEKEIKRLPLSKLQLIFTSRKQRIDFIKWIFKTFKQKKEM